MGVVSGKKGQEGKVGGVLWEEEALGGAEGALSVMEPTILAVCY